RAEPVITPIAPLLSTCHASPGRRSVAADQASATDRPALTSEVGSLRPKAYNKCRIPSGRCRQGGDSAPHRSRRWLAYLAVCGELAAERHRLVSAPNSKP